MARKRTSRVGTILVLSIFTLAAYGGWTLYNKKEVKNTMSKVEKSVKAAKKAW